MALSALRQIGPFAGRQASELAIAGQGLWQALKDHRAGQFEQALLAYGRLLRQAQLCRETLPVYRAIETLLADHRNALAAHQIAWQQPERMVFFLGYSRSGHSLVGSLLDAHPDILIAHEAHALKHIAAGVAAHRVLKALQINAYFYHYFGREYTGYDYQVPGQYQGQLTRPVIIGDKKGNGSARLLRRHPELLFDLEQRLGCPFQLVHVLRNPWDNIATKAKRTGASLDTAAQRYFANCQLIDQLQARFPNRFVEVYLEQLIAAPKPTLTQLLKALSIDNLAEDYLDACAGIVFTKPNRSALKVAWPDGLKVSIERQIAEYPFLSPYAHPEAGP
ncbi:MAG: sulfotransferase [Methylococcales bacterium]|nr:sulfotransferase [Methylococcales bacterium]